MSVESTTTVTSAMDLDRFIPNRSMDLDRFIPNRAAMDFDFARYILGGGKKVDELTSDYQRVLADALGMNRTRILEFKSPAPVKLSRYSLPDYNPSMPKSNLKPKPPRQIPPTPVQFFTTRELVGDYGLNLLDWGSRNILAIGLVDSVYLWDATKSSAFVLGELEEEIPVTSVSWAPDGQHIAVGVLDGTSKIQIWDSTSNKKLQTLRACGPYRVGSMTWNNNHILTAGTRSGQIINYDLRIKSGSCCVLGYRGHTQEICGLKWAASGRELATGGNDNLLQIWDIRRRAKCLHKLGDHTAAVRALDWCPFDRNLLASGAGEGDGCIKFWNTVTGACLNSIDTGSEVCSLLWNKNERELLSSHGLPQNQLTLWKYPSMAKISELTDHTSRVLYMAASPNGCTVASSAGDGDESMRLWNVFGVPERVKPEPFANVNRIR